MSASSHPAIMKTLTLILIAALAIAALALAAESAAGPICKLPPETVRGLAHRLDQYPTVSLASPSERSRATSLLVDLREAATRWRDPKSAARAGYDTTRPRRKPGNNAVLWFHAENRRYSNDHRYLNSRQPEVIIYADAPGKPLVLVGVMFSMPRGKHGSTPGGPIIRWHWHRVCAMPGKRGLTPGPDGTCPRGATMRNGSEMMHVWFTRDLRSSFAIHAPVPDLCVAGLLPHDRCGG
jgi:hypothetical protein